MGAAAASISDQSPASHTHRSSSWNSCALAFPYVCFICSHPVTTHSSSSFCSRHRHSAKSEHEYRNCEFVIAQVMSRVVINWFLSNISSYVVYQWHTFIHVYVTYRDNIRHPNPEPETGNWTAPNSPNSTNVA